MDYLKLGASLYVPAINNDLLNIINGEKYPNLKSVILDTEDSINEKDLDKAYINIKNVLNNFEKKKNILVFIRVRNFTELHKIYEFENISKIDGFVLPKFTIDNMNEYFRDIKDNFLYMPILETDVFKVSKLEKVCDFLLPFKNRILSIRIGATDILSLLSCRRSNNMTIYDIAVMNKIISNIIINFKPYGFNITGVVFESFNENKKEILEKEVELDLLNGLFGKTIIHPNQIDIVQNMYKVTKSDFESANLLLNESMPSVFNIEKCMNEKAPHINWAKKILSLAEIYGIRE